MTKGYHSNSRTTRQSTALWSRTSGSSRSRIHQLIVGLMHRILVPPLVLWSVHCLPFMWWPGHPGEHILTNGPCSSSCLYVHSNDHHHPQDVHKKTTNVVAGAFNPNSPAIIIIYVAKMHLHVPPASCREALTICSAVLGLSRGSRQTDPGMHVT